MRRIKSLSIMELKEFEALCDTYNEVYEALRSLKKDDITMKIAYYAVSQYGLSLELIPEKLITSELCWLAVHNGECPDGDAISFVPSEFISYDLCLKAVACKTQTLPALRSIPGPFKDYNICLEGVRHHNQQNYLAIEFVPDEFRDFNLCKVAFEAEPKSIEFFPDDIKAKFLT